MGAHPRFECVAAVDYERTHAGYAHEAVDWVDEELGLRGEVIVDLAAGTGKLTRLLTKMSSHVVAVEPAGNMLAVLSEVVPDTCAVRGTAENVPLADASAHCITVGGSFHLFAIDQAASEIRRVLRPAGALALFWKVYDMDHPIQAALDQIAAPYLEGRGDRINRTDPSWTDALSGTGLFAPAKKRSFLHNHAIEANDLASILTTSTDAAWLPHERLRELTAEVNGFAKDLPERVTLPGVTEVFLYSQRF